MRSWSRCAVTLSLLAGTASTWGQCDLQGGGTPNLSPPTADEPVLFIQPYRPLNDPFESWWPTNWATRWDRRFVPMLPLNILGLESAENAPPHHLKKAARRIPDDPVVCDHLGDTWDALKEPGKARYYWQKSVNLEPGKLVPAKGRKE